MATKKKVDQPAGQASSSAPRYPVDLLLTSKAIKGKYQQDFVRAILGNGLYTMDEAIKKLSDYFEGGK